MENWTEYRLVDLCTKVVSGGTPLTSNRNFYEPAEIPWLKTGEVKYSNIYETESYISQEGLNNSSAKLLPINSIIIAMYGDTAGRVAVNKIPLATNQACCNLLIDDTKADYCFVYYYLWTQYKQMVLLKTGGAQPNLNVEKIKKLKILLPRLPIQQKIAEILSRYDEAIENNNKRIKLLEQMARNLYKEWFVRFRFPGYESAEFENGLPKGWKIVTLNEYADVEMGQSPESEFYNEDRIGLPFHQGIATYGDFYLQDKIYSSKGNRFAEPNSIIFSVRAPVGRINLTLNKIILGRGVAGINAKNKNNDFLLWSLKEKFSKEDSIGNGSIFTSVSKPELLKQKLIIPISDLENKFNSITHNIESQIRNITIKSKILTRQRDLLLPRLMSGKLQVK